MNKKELLILGAAAIAAYLILKQGGVLGTRSTVVMRPGSWWDDADGSDYSATGDDIRGRH